MAVTAIFGGAFDPPHIGHVALARAAMEHFGLDDLHVTVVARRRRTRTTDAPAEDRLAARAARVRRARRDRRARAARATRSTRSRPHGYDDPVFLIGADELADFPTWKEPERVLELARLGVATRPGYRPRA